MYRYYPIPFQKELELVKRTKRFGEEKFGLTYQKTLTQYDGVLEKGYVLAASYPDRIEVPPGFGKGQSSLEHFSKKRELKKRISELREKGFHIATSQSIASLGQGTSDRLLKNSKEYILKVVLHEGFHDYLYSKKFIIPYPIEEAAADVIGFYGALEYASENDDIDITKVTKMKKSSEEFKLLVNENTSALFHA